MAGSDYIDWENKSCNFNSDDFIQFLEFTNKFPSELPDDIWDRYTDTAYREDASLFQNSYLDGFRIYRRYKDGAFGEDISFIGFPNPSGKDTAVIYPEYVFAISSQSKNAEGAWQFLRTLLSEEYQDKIEYNFPIRKSSFDKMAEASKEKEFYMDDDKKVYYDDTYYLGDTEVTIGTLTDEDIQYVTNYIKSIKNVYSYNQSIMDIINEEAQDFYNGTKKIDTLYANHFGSMYTDELVSYYYSKPRYKNCDFDGNGYANMADAVLLLRFISEDRPEIELPPEALRTADINSDGILDLTDAQLLMDALHR
jgi:ABC-type glycerol-3-phosphate transport system substrate-binding protein